MLSAFLTGVICTLYVVGAIFFLRFWRSTRDSLFLAFAIAFVIEGVNRARFVVFEQPSEGSASIYLVRLLAFIVIAAAIAAKNVEGRSQA
jgi:uncharacterized membrane protein HdeD (DUF308 family)